MGSDREVKSDFLLLAGTNRDLAARVAQGRFREDLLARIHLWKFRLPGLRERPEDIEPNLRYELDKAGQSLGVHVTMSREARGLFLAFAVDPSAAWSANFRDLNAAVLRMATLAKGGRISEPEVLDEIERLRSSWASPAGAATSTRTSRSRPGPDEPEEPDLVAAALGPEEAAALDRFDRAQLADVLRVCQLSSSLSAAGRLLFASSRARKAAPNDADRLRKYLARFGLSWARVGRP
jgi:transcriptional regulatory protein RtcR